MGGDLFWLTNSQFISWYLLCKLILLGQFTACKGITQRCSGRTYNTSKVYKRTKLISIFSLPWNLLLWEKNSIKQNGETDSSFYLKYFDTAKGALICFKMWKRTLKDLLEWASDWNQECISSRVLLSGWWLPKMKKQKNVYVQCLWHHLRFWRAIGWGLYTFRI